MKMWYIKKAGDKKLEAGLGMCKKRGEGFLCLQRGRGKHPVPMHFYAGFFTNVFYQCFISHTARKSSRNVNLLTRFGSRITIYNLEDTLVTN